MYILMVIDWDNQLGVKPISSSQTSQCMCSDVFLEFWRMD